MNRKLLYLTTIILTLAGCASEDYVGDERLHEANEKGRPVSFNLTSAPQTRSERYGAEAASDLNKNFVVWGDKTFGEAPNEVTQTVFDNYQVNYVTNSANTTTSNSAGWEYVGYTSKKNVEQSIKYWDYSAAHYDFFAYSLGKGDKPNDLENTSYAAASILNGTDYTFTLSGSADQLKACYISNKKTISPSGSSGTQVELQFRNFASNVKMAFYEIVPGYSVKDVKFYDADGKVGNVPNLYASSAVLPTQGTYTVSFDANGKAGAQLYKEADAPVAATYTNNMAFGTALTYTAGKEYLEEDATQYIGRSSNLATPTTAITMLPNPSGTDLYLKVDYTLVSRDGYGENIKVTGATAVVPAAYAQWQPNYSYTYLFKISDNTNGTTGQNILGLSPITLDAVVNTDAEGRQETVTTVTNPSITTYQKGSDYASTDEYNEGRIYIVVADGTVADGTGLATLTITGESVNAKLYKATVTLADPTTDVANVTEASVENAIGKSDAKDANGNAMTVTAVDSDEDDALALTNEVAAADSPDGKAIVFRTPAANEDPDKYKAVKFDATADANTTAYYVFEYTYTESSETKKVYKVIKVKGETTTPTP